MDTITIKKSQFDKILTAVEEASKRGVEKGFRAALRFMDVSPSPTCSVNQIYARYNRGKRSGNAQIKRALSEMNIERTGDALNSKALVNVKRFEEIFYNN